MTVNDRENDNGAIHLESSSDEILAEASEAKAIEADSRGLDTNSSSLQSENNGGDAPDLSREIRREIVSSLSEIKAVIAGFLSNQDVLKVGEIESILGHLWRQLEKLDANFREENDLNRKELREWTLSNLELLKLLNQSVEIKQQLTQTLEKQNAYLRNSDAALQRFESHLLELDEPMMSLIDSIPNRDKGIQSFIAQNTSQWEKKVETIFASWQKQQQSLINNVQDKLEKHLKELKEIEEKTQANTKAIQNAIQEESKALGANQQTIWNGIVKNKNAIAQIIDNSDSLGNWSIFKKILMVGVACYLLVSSGWNIWNVGKSFGWWGKDGYSLEYQRYQIGEIYKNTGWTNTKLQRIEKRLGTDPKQK